MNEKRSNNILRFSAFLLLIIGTLSFVYAAFVYHPAPSGGTAQAVVSGTPQDPVPFGLIYVTNPPQLWWMGGQYAWDEETECYLSINSPARVCFFTVTHGAQPGEWATYDSDPSDSASGTYYRVTYN